MSILSAFFEALAGDPPKPFIPPTAAEFPDDEVSRAFVEAIRDRRQFMIERDAYKAELLRLGYTEFGLANRVKFYDGTLRRQVKAG